VKPGFARNEQRPGLSLSQQRIHPLIGPRLAVPHPGASGMIVYSLDREDR
jgi:hypothetical protein